MNKYIHIVYEYIYIYRKLTQWQKNGNKFVMEKWI